MPNLEQCVCVVKKLRSELATSIPSSAAPQKPIEECVGESEFVQDLLCPT